MDTKLCCPECFGDNGLRVSIFPARSHEYGDCSFCGTKNTILLEPTALAPYFELLADIYVPSTVGKSLVEWMKEDWLLFSHSRMDDAHAKELLSEIFDDGNIVRQLVVPSPDFASKRMLLWETLRDEMMYKNRWFLDTEIDTKRLRQLLDMLVVNNLSQKWYRARIREGDVPFPIGEMGSPPKRHASYGRANPAGIPCLYLSSKPETAIAETRPHPGEVACVADFTIPNIRAVDLRNPRKLVSPFILSDTSEIGQLRSDIPFLERLGNELTRPVVPKGAAIDYIPSQYLCEFIRKCGFDGVVYSSSMSDGINIALFHPHMASVGTVAQYSVSKVDVVVHTF